MNNIKLTSTSRMEFEEKKRYDETFFNKLQRSPYQPALEDVSSDDDLYDLVDSCSSVCIEQNNNICEKLIDNAAAAIGDDSDPVPIIIFENHKSVVVDTNY
ncbi:hypothetical protein DPMN_035437 [Dreissena polymorpha]|uniref:Uncharacterized protein n=1 Tax=Dreissena polymorpha TaxID=45954 RepID=A0A9D4RMW6_DREPO|nr:hypothetical protein DPMN_035437 [Dreissena polymorpha]